MRSTIHIYLAKVRFALGYPENWLLLYLPSLRMSQDIRYENEFFFIDILESINVKYPISIRDIQCRVCVCVCLRFFIY